MVENLAALNRVKNWHEVIKKLYACDTLRVQQEKIGIMMPHVLESESWEVLEKQIDLYEMEKRDIISKGYLKGKTGKGDKKRPTTQTNRTTNPNYTFLLFSYHQQ